MRQTALGVWLLALLAAVGCGAGDAEYQAAAAVVEERLAAQDEIADILGRIQGPAQMEEARADLRKRYQHLEALALRAQELGNISQGTKNRLQESLGTRISRSTERLAAESRRVEQLPGGVAFLKSLQAAP